VLTVAHSALGLAVCTAELTVAESIQCGGGSALAYLPRSLASSLKPDD